MIRKLASALAMATLCSIAGAAEEVERKHYLNVMGHYLVTDDDRQTDGDGFGALYGYGYRLNPNISVEAQAFTNQLETDAGTFTDFYQYGGGVDLMLRAFGHDGVDPFVIGGIGGVYDDVIPDSDDGFSFFGNVGLGVLTGALNRGGLRLRLEARYMYNRFEFRDADNISDWRIGAGLQIPLGSKVVEREVERERIVTKTKEVPAKIVDSDGDGVPDQIDECPDTLEGLATDSRGCASSEPQIVRLEGVNFELDSAHLKPGAREILKETAQSLRGEPNLRVEIAGHTDSQGPASYNLNLSKRRASAVKSFLINEGIEPRRMEVKGYGEAQPVASNDTAAGRQENRRVEFRVLN